jgi:N-acetylmuramoyl-L-alanine amidase
VRAATTVAVTPRQLVRAVSAIIVACSIFGCSAGDRRNAGEDPRRGSACPDAFVVAIDVGHGRQDPGAVSAVGIPEFEYNRQLASELMEGLRRAGFVRSFLINGDGARSGSDGLVERARQASAGRADLFVSIHHDSVQERYLQHWMVDGQRRLYADAFEGYSIFYSEGGGQARQSLQFARMLADELQKEGRRPSAHHAEDIPGERRALVDPARGIYEAGFRVIKDASMPAVLFEAGIILNRRQERLLAAENYRAGFVKAITAAVAEFCRQGKRAEHPHAGRRRT